MKRDHELVRALLTEIEETPPNSRPSVKYDGRDRDTVFEHLELLAEAGLIEASLMKVESTGRRIHAAEVIRLTWEGHEFIANSKSPGAWQKAMSTIASKGGSAGFDVLRDLLKLYAAQQFGLSG